MTRLTFSLVAATLALSACSKVARSADPKTMTGPQLSDETRRCRDLGLKAYDDPACKRAQQESNDRFYGTRQERAP